MSESENARTEPRRRRAMAAGESASEAVVDSITTATGDDPCSLPPLSDHVDVDALDGLVEPESSTDASGIIFTRTEDIATDVKVQFEYAGYDVTVTENYVLLE